MNTRKRGEMYFVLMASRSQPSLSRREDSGVVMKIKYPAAESLAQLHKLGGGDSARMKPNKRLDG
jgi:hypothetical protein